jgi:predicted transcriptional regulator
MKRTTIVVSEKLLIEAQHLAKTLNKTTSELIREALQEYIQNHKLKKRRQLSFIGVGRSGRGDIAERSEELLGKLLAKKDKNGNNC